MRDVFYAFVYKLFFQRNFGKFALSNILCCDVGKKLGTFGVIGNLSII